MMMGLVGCGANNEGATNSGESNRMLPVGYYSNENHSGDGNVRINDDNDGPLTEIMDNTYGSNGLRSVSNEDGKQQKENNNNMFNREPRFSRNDANYHGHLKRNNGPTRSSYYTAYDGKLAEQIRNTAAKVENVQDAEASIKDNRVIVAVILEDASKERETKAAVRDALKPQMGGKSLTVVTDEGTYSRIRTIDHSLREGNPKEEITHDMNNMFRSIGNRTNQNVPITQ